MSALMTEEKISIGPFDPYELFTVDETANKLRISRRTLYNLISDKVITPKKIKDKTVFTRQEIERYIREL